MKRPPLDRSRRRALESIGSIGITTVAGCLTSVSHTDSCSDSTGFSLTEATTAHISNEFSTPVDGLPHASKTVVADALDTESGESTSRGYYSPRPQTEFVVTSPEARYYLVSTADHDATEITAYEYTAEIDVDASAPAEGEPIRSFPELPLHDRESLLDAIRNPSLLHAPHYTSFSVVFAYERGDVREQSVFVPSADRHYLEWDETLLRLTSAGRRTVEIASTTVTTELVAESPDEFVGHIGGKRGVTLDSLTSQQRDIVTEAIEGTYSECEPYSEPFSDLREEISGGRGESAPLVQYNETWYFSQLS